MNYGIYITKDEILQDKIKIDITVTYSSYIKVRANSASEVNQLCRRLNGMEKYSLCHVKGDYHLITFEAPNEELLLSLYRDITISVSNLTKKQQIIK